ncbi:MAG TPA: DUF885 domain-containing protein [Kineosporiaceae bacterium]|nr:DUF885 domain-containing protein [Kineosporiaceae bacterium]
MDTLAQRFFRFASERNAIEAAQLGLDWLEGILPDLSAPAEESRLACARGMRAEVDGLIGRYGGDPRGEPGLTLRLLGFELDCLIGDIEAGWSQFTVDGSFVGPSALLLGIVPKAQLDDEDQLQRYLQRLAAAPAYLAQATAQLALGAAAGRTPTRCGIAGALTQIDAYLSCGPGADPFVHDPSLGVRLAGSVAAQGVRERIAAVVAEAVRPAVAAYREALVQRFLPVARPDERAGVGHVPGGEAAYAAALRRYSSAGLTADQVHRLGLDAIAELHEEVARIGERVLRLRGPQEVFAALRARTDLRFAGEDEMIRYCRGAMERASDALPRMLGTLPVTGCVLGRMNEAESLTGALAYYQPPGMLNGRPGTYWLNVSGAATRPRYEYEALTFHESVPGHHTQVARQQELTGLPDFRRTSYVVAYVEGWALYTERLCDELGLYSGDLDRLGMLSFALWRAGRLVVDTGIHAQGWSRDRAIAFLSGATGLTPVNVTNEVDRYISWPGQATGYYLGYDRIAAARRERREAEGAAFDLRAFHDRLLGLGPVPMFLLPQVLAG